MKNFFLFSLTLFLILPISALAIEEEGGVVKIEAEEELNYNLVKFANEVVVEGKVNGDVIVAGATVTINGPVSGDVIAAANTIKINSEVAGDVRVAAFNIEINGKIGKNANLFGSSIKIGEQAEIGGDLTCWGDNITILGKIQGDVDGGGRNIVLNNETGGNVNLNIDSGGDLKLADKTLINGDLTYKAAKQIQIPAISQIKGKINYLVLKEKEDNKFLSATYWFKKVIAFFSLLLIAVIVLSLRPQFFERLTQKITGEPGLSLGLGVIYLLAIPLVVLVLLLSIIGIPLAIIIFSFYLVTLYLSKIVLAVWLGRKILPGLKSNTWALILGLLVIVIATSLSYLGGSVSLIIICLALGGLGQVFKESFRTQ